MSTRPRKNFRSLLAAVERETKRASDVPQRTSGGRDGPDSLSAGDGISLGTLEGYNPTSFPQYNETTFSRPPAKDERETTIPVIKEDEAASSTPSVEVNRATPLSQKDKTVEGVHSSVEDIKTDLLRQDEKAVDCQLSPQDKRATSSQAVVTAQPPGSIEDDSACEYKVCCVRRYSG